MQLLMSTCNLFMSTRCTWIYWSLLSIKQSYILTKNKLHININKLHFNTFILYINITKLHVSINKLHINMIKLHIDINDKQHLECWKAIFDNFILLLFSHLIARFLVCQHRYVVSSHYYFGQYICPACMSIVYRKIIAHRGQLHHRLTKIITKTS